jgi:hypothetical protein
MASVSTTHPLYADANIDWEQMRDTYKGQRAVKEKAFKYLSPTSGMIADGVTRSTTSKGWIAYMAYLTRARYPGLIRRAVEGLIGVMHNKPATFELPASMEYLISRATLDNESLQMLLQKVNEEQLIEGRLGLLGDIQNDGINKGLFYISLYVAEDVINWDDGAVDDVEQSSLNLVVLDETDDERKSDGDIFAWERVTKHRVLILGNPGENEPAGDGVYQFEVIREGENFDADKLEAPQFGANVAKEIPFVFINTKDIVSSPDTPPLLDLSNLTLTIYRGEADYRQSLFMTGQDTLVVIGEVEDGEKERRVGANVSINLPIDGDAKYIGIDSAGIPEQRAALENDYSAAKSNTGELVETNSRDAESGEALKIRVSARTATLNQVALTGAFGVEQMLKKLGRWMGLSDSEVDNIKVIPNMDFVDDTMSGVELAQLMGSKMLGAPISIESIHALMQQRGLTEKTVDEELAQILKETEAGIGMPAPSTNDNGPEDEDDDEDADATTDAGEDDE